MTQTDPRSKPADRPGQRDLPDRLQNGLEGLRDRIGANKAVAATAAVVAVVLLIAIVAAVIASGGDDALTAAPEDGASSSAAADDGTAAPAFPVDGDYLVRQEASGLCLTNGPEPGNQGRSVIVLGDCAETYPEGFAFTAVKEGIYTVGLDFYQDDWQACWGVDGSDQEGYLSAGQDCEELGVHQQFRLDDVGTDSYNVVVVASGMCMGILEDAVAEKGAALATALCDPDDPAQRFALLVP